MDKDVAVMVVAIDSKQKEEVVEFANYVVYPDGADGGHIKPSFSKANSRPATPMYFKKKRGIIPDGLWQMQL